MAVRYDVSVFLNVPFDSEYEQLFFAMIFAVYDCGFIPRCAQEIDDGAQIRFEKICGLMSACRYGIHDISRTDVDAAGLPRFNMPLELGLFLGARRFGSAPQRRKNCLILDRDRYRYQRFCSDIAGQDIRAHGGRADEALRQVRNWLASALRPRHTLVPGAETMFQRYAQFQSHLPSACRQLGLSPRRLTFADYTELVSRWQHANRW
jgi:hypothetical protein